VAAGVFTQNRVKAAPVLITQKHIQKNPDAIRAVVVNTKSANACTGDIGMKNGYKMAQRVAESIDCEPHQVLVMSTGVIGSHLPVDKISSGIQQLSSLSETNWEAAARAIMTTDTRPKLASETVQTEHGSYTIGGISKGSGMIAPNMATMLGIIVTDVQMTPSQAQTALSQAAAVSYNRIVVDGDTSTNDMVTLLANGESGVSLDSDTAYEAFVQALTRVCTSLAQAIVRDGEGASKFITVHVQNAPSDEDARNIAHTLAASALVKTAFYGNDANWGRIMAAAGRAGIPFDADKARLWITPGETTPPDDNPGLLLYENGIRTGYTEADADAIMNEPSIYITLDIAAGDGQAQVWTCDLSHEYVSINADYRT
jgi:glutamate N-acetyltransferase/amino-acid N-acetyltransferase